jgi:hypothetical protein
MRVPVVLAALVMFVAAAPAAADAPAVSRGQAVRVTKHAASREAARLGLSLPPSAWTAACYRARRGPWRCEAGAGQGYCSASVRVSGTRGHPRAGRVRVFCLG